MKVNDLFEGRFVGYDLPNKKGVLKRFPNDWSADAVAWMNSEIEPRYKDQAKFSKAKKKWYVPSLELTRAQHVAQLNRKLGITAREPTPKPKGPPLKLVYDKFMEMVDRFFPDGDPTDYMGPFFRRHGVEYGGSDWIDRALKRHGTGIEKKGAYYYLGSMWEEQARDRAYDAEQDLKDGHDSDDYYPWCEIKDGKVVLGDNPYWSTEQQNKERAKFEKADAAWKKKYGINEEAYPRYRENQELIVSGEEGFMASLSIPATNRTGQTKFSRAEHGVDKIIVFSHDDGEFVYFRGVSTRTLWKAEREPFYANVVSRGKNFLNKLVDKDEAPPSA